MIRSFLASLRAGLTANPRKVAVLVSAVLVVGAISAGMAGAYGLNGGNCYGYDYATSEACSDANSTEVQQPYAQWYTTDEAAAYAGGAVHFEGDGYNPALDDGSPTSYKWQWGDGSADLVASGADGAAPAHTYADAGNYDVRLTVTFSDNTTQTYFDSLSVDPKPKPYVYWFEQNQVKTGTPAQFTTEDAYDPADSSNTADTYTWSWGDGTPDSSGMSVPHTFSEAGRYVVTETVDFHDGQSASHKEVVNVSDDEPATVSFNSSDGTAGGTAASLYADVDSGSSASQVTNYSWFFDGSTTPDFSGADKGYIQKLFPAGTAGSHTVKLVVTFEDNTTAQFTGPLWVLSDTAPHVSAYGYPEAGKDTTFSAYGADPNDGSDTVSNYTWSWGDGSADTSGPDANVSHTYAAAGPYTLQVHATFSGGGSADYERVISVQPEQHPGANFYTNNGTPTTGSPVDFTGYADGVDGADVTSWSYDFGDPNDDTEGTVQNPAHTYTESGEYVVTLTVTFDDASSAQYTDVVDVYDPGTPYASFNTGGKLKPNETVTFHTSEVDFPNEDSENPPAYTYDWDFGDKSAHSTAQNPTHQYAHADQYKVTLTVTDPNDDSTAVSIRWITISNDRAPLAGFAWRSESPVAGSYVTFTGVGFDPDDPDTTATNYAWNFGDGSATVSGASNTAAHKYTDAGQYTTTLTVTFSDSSTKQRTQTVYVDALEDGGQVVSQQANAGGTVSTGSTTSSTSPVAASVQTPVAGAVTIETHPSYTEDAPTGYSFLGQQVNITAPDATDPANPLRLTFLVDNSVIPAGTTLHVFRNGTLVPDCLQPDGTTQTHLPCMLPLQTVGSATQVTVLTMRASNWNFGTNGVSTGGDNSGGGQTTTGGETGGSTPAAATPGSTSGTPTAVAALKMTVTIAKVKLKAALAKGLKATVNCSAACHVTAQLVLPAKTAKKLKLKGALAKGSGKSAKAGKVVVTLKFTAKAKKALKKLKSVKATLVLTSGKTVTKKVVLLKR